MKSLAERFREAGIKVGDVVELVSAADSLTDDINEWLNEGEEWKGDAAPPAQMEGLLVEVTAIGETRVLCYWLEGQTTAESKTYAACLWVRRPNGHETQDGGDKAFRLIYRDGVCLHPNLMNVYSRCRE